MSTKYKKTLVGISELVDRAYKQIDASQMSQWEHKQQAIERVSEVFVELYHDAEKEGIDTEQLFPIISSVDAYVHEINGTLRHIYLTKEVRDFLLCQEVKDSDMGITFLDEVAIQTPDEGFVVISTNLSNMEKYAIIHNDLQKSLYVKYDKTTGSISDSVNKNLNMDSVQYFKLYLNLMYYLKWKPECIIDGVPADMAKSDRKSYKGQNARSVTLTDEIAKKCTRDSSGRLIMPHSVAGFFRTYRDDRYVNMKGKVQWIAPFYRGKNQVQTVVKEGKVKLP